MNVKPIYTNKLFKKGLEFAANNGTLFVATASLALSSVARPLAIMSTPKTDKENRQYAASKSIASSVGYALMLTASIPLANSIKKIDDNPKNFLKEKTIKTLQNGEKTLTKSSKYKFATQLFKLGLGFVIAVPKSILTCSLIPNIMDFLDKKPKTPNKKSKEIQFTGLEKPISKMINKPLIQKLADKFHKTNYEQHIISATDVLATGAFITQTHKNKKIKENRKNTLIYNSAISSGLSITGGYLINRMTKKSTNRFIKNFKQANKNSPKLDKYIEGIKIAKPALILGRLYYIAIPVLSTFMAERVNNKK